MSGGQQQRMLLGRSAERAAIGRLLADARAGRSGALMLRGEAGIGKTVLLEDVAEHARGMRVLRTAGVPGEAELPFAGLHLLLHSVTDRIQQLPQPQAVGLRGALGLAPAQGVDQFTVGVALLSLFADLAEDGGLLVLVDDAHWLDQGSVRALVFAARRLRAEGVVILLTARSGEGDRGGVLAGSDLPELVLSRLDEQAAGALLTKYGVGLAEGVRARVIAEADGNPLALLELPKGLSVGQRQGSLAPLPVAVSGVSAPSRVQESFADRFKQLPAATQTLLLVAAAEAAGEVHVILEAARRLGSHLEDAEAAERCGLVVLTAASLAFRHPLVRAAAYHGAPVAERMDAHNALAAALQGAAEHADRRAWHLAAATVEPDETVAVALEEAARRAYDRGGTAAAAAALERAAQLSPDPDAKAARLAGAAEAALAAGQPDRAYALAALGAGADGPAAAKLAMIRANVAFQYRQAPKTAAGILLEAARPAARDDPALAARMLAVAASAARFDADPATAERVFAALEALPPAGEEATAMLVAATRGVQRLLGGDYAGAIPLLRDLVAHAGSTTELPPLTWLTHPTFVALWTGDEQAARDLAEAQVATYRARGMVGSLPVALMYLSMAQLVAGQHTDARTTAAEGLRLSQDTGQIMELGLCGGVFARLAAIEGDRQRCEALAKDAQAQSTSKRLIPPLALSVSALNLLDVGLGRYEEALDRQEAVPRGTIGDAIMLAFGLPDLIEAAVRAGAPAKAEELLDRYQDWATHSAQTWAQAVAHRCQALVHPGQDAQQQYRAALQLHADGRRPFEHARTRLAYGQWLRRNRRRTDARVQLRAAWQTFDRLGAAPWARQALVELRAAGETAQPAPARPDPLGSLTSQELQVVRLAATGASNRDIAAQLFLSPRTVGYHLYKAYPKLGITSRHELIRLLRFS